MNPTEKHIKIIEEKKFLSTCEMLREEKRLREAEKEFLKKRTAGQKG